jgi:hypothetical protein
MINNERMYKINLFLILFILPFVGINAQEALISETQTTSKTIHADGPKAVWDTTIHDLGNLIYKSKKKVDYTLTNNGNQPLFITYAQSSCGCAHLEYDPAPVLPGKSTKVTVTYHGTEMGDFMKTISVVTNADTDRTILQIKGKVVEQ